MDEHTQDMSNDAAIDWILNEPKYAAEDVVTVYEARIAVLEIQLRFARQHIARLERYYAEQEA